LADGLGVKLEAGEAHLRAEEEREDGGY
jgi:hypothetical protein